MSPMLYADDPFVFETGFLAFIDVLGFSELLRGDRAAHRLRGYNNTIEQFLKGSSIHAVVFSDSVVLTMPGTTVDDLFKISRVCSGLLYGFVQEELAVRGAISYGKFTVRPIGEVPGTFVAGPAMVEAYRWEGYQKWIGVIYSPSVTEVFGEPLRTNCDGLWGNLSAKPDTTSPPWHLTAQRNRDIPVSMEKGKQPLSHDGFAILPSHTNVELTAQDTRATVRKTIRVLDRMKLFAGSPQDGHKYSETISWLADIHDNFLLPLSPASGEEARLGDMVNIVKVTRRT